MFLYNTLHRICVNLFKRLSSGLLVGLPPISDHNVHEHTELEEKKKQPAMTIVDEIKHTRENSWQSDAESM